MFKKIVLLFGVLLYANTAIAGGDSSQLSGAEVKALFTDKTQYCEQQGKDSTCKTFNAADGRVTRVMDADGVRRVGNWRVSATGEYCLRWDGKKKDLCFTVFSQQDGSYHLLRKGKHKATITKFLDGNSENM